MSFSNSTPSPHFKIRETVETHETPACFNNFNACQIKIFLTVQGLSLLTQTENLPRLKGHEIEVNNRIKQIHVALTQQAVNQAANDSDGLKKRTLPHPNRHDAKPRLGAHGKTPDDLLYSTGARIRAHNDLNFCNATRDIRRWRRLPSNRRPPARLLGSSPRTSSIRSE